MKIKRIAVMLSAVILLAGSAVFAQEKEPVLTTKEAKTITQGNNDFAVELYKKINGNYQESNIFFSPFSIYMAYAMLFEGAAGETALEYINLFGFPQDENARREAMKEELSRYQDKKSDYGVFTANSLWVNKKFPVMNSYKYTLRDYYFADLNLMDFSKASSVNKMNKWVSKNTNKRIKEIISHGQVDDNTKLVLINTIYFKEKWMIPFDKETTQDDDFFLPDSTKITVKLMKQKEKYFFYENNKVQAVKMRYKGGANKLSMIAVLPKQNKVSDAEEFIFDNSIQEINEKMTMQQGIIYLPKFEMDWKIDLARVMSSLGITTSDYSRISRSAINVSNVLHSSFIKIDEEETEAAAATAIITKMSLPIEREEPPFVFRADHPFIYMIVDETDGKILFIGKMYKPASKN